MNQICGKCIHMDVCFVPRTTGCVEYCKHFKKDLSMKQEQTNEEWLRSCSTEELAEWIYNAIFSFNKEFQNKIRDNAYMDMLSIKDEITEWLKEKHIC